MPQSQNRSPSPSQSQSQSRTVSVLKKDPFSTATTNYEAPEFLSRSKAAEFTKRRKPVKDIIFKFEKFFMMPIDVGHYHHKFSEDFGYTSADPPGEIFRLFGCNDFGNSICLHVHGYRPCLSVACPINLGPSEESKLLSTFREAIRMRHASTDGEGDQDTERDSHQYQHSPADPYSPSERQKGPCTFGPSSITSIRVIEGINIYGYRSLNAAESRRIIEITVCCTSGIHALSADIRQGLLSSVWHRLGLDITGLGINQQDNCVFDSNIDTTTKFMSDVGFTGCGWISIDKSKYRIREEGFGGGSGGNGGERKVSRCQIELDCDVKDIAIYDPIDNTGKDADGRPLRKVRADLDLSRLRDTRGFKDIKDIKNMKNIGLDIDDINPNNLERGRIPPIRVLSFDIECQCESGFAQPDRKEDKVIQISMIVKIINNTPLTDITTDREGIVYQCILTLGQCSPISGVEVISFKDDEEYDLLYAFGELLNEIDPDVITGYNIENFDIHYLVTRMQYLKTGKKKVKEGKGGSSGSSSRTVIDPSYKVPRQIANDRRRVCDYSKLIGRLCMSRPTLFSSNQMGTREMNRTELPGIYTLDIFLAIQVNYKLRSYSLNSVSMFFLKEQKEDVHHSMISKLNNTPDNRRHLAVYCLKDALLPLRLIDKLYVLYNNIEMARVNKIPVDYVSNKGQGVKVLTQIYDLGKRLGLHIPDNVGGQQGRQGGRGRGSGGYGGLDLGDEDFDDDDEMIGMGGRGKGRRKQGEWESDDDSELVSDEEGDDIGPVGGSIDSPFIHPGADEDSLDTEDMGDTDDTEEKDAETGRKTSAISPSSTSPGMGGAGNTSSGRTASQGKSGFGIGMGMGKNKGTKAKGKTKAASKVGYKGATVIKPRKGYYSTNQPISVLDFSSLYPSIMIAYNMDYSTWLSNSAAYVSAATKDNKEPLKLPYDLTTDDISLSPSGELFVKPHVKEGIMPMILSKLLRQRSIAKKDMETAESDIDKKVLNARQLALKITANSVYGFTGSSVGKLPCFAISSSVTAYGREMIDKTKAYVEHFYNIHNQDNRIKGNPVLEGHVDKDGNKQQGLINSPNVIVSRVIYGDTDSVMIKFGVDNITDAILLGREAAKDVTALFAKPINLEFEKVYCPFLLLTKKRYAGLLYTPAFLKTGHHDKLDMKGIESTRRDNCRLAAELLNRVLECLMVGHWRDEEDEKEREREREMKSTALSTKASANNNIIAAISLTKEVIRNLLQQRIDISYLVISKGYTKPISEYKARQPHIELVKKKLGRKETVHIGDRIQYVIVSNDTRAAAALSDGGGRGSGGGGGGRDGDTGSGKDKEKGSSTATTTANSSNSNSDVKLFDKAEDPLYVLEHGYTIDTSYYLENQIKPILSRIFLHLGRNECDLEDAGLKGREGDKEREGEGEGELSRRDTQSSGWILKEVFEGAHTRCVKIGQGMRMGMGVGTGAGAGKARGKARGMPAGIAGFVQVEQTCQICKVSLNNIQPPTAPRAALEKEGDSVKRERGEGGEAAPFYLKEKETGICLKCLTRGHLPLTAFKAYEKLKVAEYTYEVVNRQCIRCAQSCLSAIDCMSNDCPIYYKRLSVLRDIEESTEECSRFALWNTGLQDE